MTLTKEWLEQSIAEIEAIRDEIPFGLDEHESNMLESLKIALASPVKPEEMTGGIALTKYRIKGSNYKQWTLGWNACRAAMLQGSVGNSPAIPDGYALVPVEPTKEMIEAGWSYYMTSKAPGSSGVYSAMLAAAPQQEV